jgi:hypothetical protein
MKTFFRHFIPRYDELTLFVMSLTCLLIFLANTDVLKDAQFSLSRGDLPSSLLLIVFFGGMGLSVYHIIVRRIKTDFEKLLMLFFAIILNAASGITGGTYALEHSQGYVAVFPIVNMANGTLLLMLLREGAINETSIVESTIQFRFVCLASGLAVLVFFICQHLLKFYWASTFSICVAYTTNISRPIIMVFSRPRKQRLKTD